MTMILTTTHTPELTTTTSSTATSAKQERRDSGNNKNPLLLRGKRSSFHLNRNSSNHHHYDDIASYYDLDYNRILGEGNFGKVIVGVHKSTKQERAIKQMEKSGSADNDQEILDEYDCLRELDHPDTIKVYDLYEDPQHFHIASDLYQGGDMIDYLEEVGVVPEFEAKAFLHKLLSCVNYLHTSRKLVHRDLKLENILLNKPGSLGDIKLIDFGLARHFQELESSTFSDLVGSTYYVSPQVIDGKYSAKCDIWAIGVIAYMLLGGYPPFDGRHDGEILQEVCIGAFGFHDEYWSDVSDEAKDFVCNLLAYEEEERPTAAQALHHPWFNNNLLLQAGEDEEQAQTNNIRVESIRSSLVSLERFHSQDRPLKQAFCCIVAEQLLTPSEDKDKIDIERINEAFNYMNSYSNTGSISPKDLEQAMEETGINKENHKDDAIQSIMEQVNYSQTGSISYSEFAVAILLDQQQQDKLMKAVFEMLDYNNDGLLSIQDLQTSLCLPGDGTDTAVGDIMFGTDCICFDEFRTYLQYSPAVPTTTTTTALDDSDHNGLSVSASGRLESPRMLLNSSEHDEEVEEEGEPAHTEPPKPKQQQGRRKSESCAPTKATPEAPPLSRAATTKPKSQRRRKRTSMFPSNAPRRLSESDQRLINNEKAHLKEKKQQQEEKLLHYRESVGLASVGATTDTRDARATTPPPPTETTTSIAVQAEDCPPLTRRNTEPAPASAPLVVQQAGGGKQKKKTEKTKKKKKKKNSDSRRKSGKKSPPQEKKARKKRRNARKKRTTKSNQKVGMSTVLVSSSGSTNHVLTTQTNLDTIDPTTNERKAVVKTRKVKQLLGGSGSHCVSANPKRKKQEFDWVSLGNTKLIIASYEERQQMLPSFNWKCIAKGGISKLEEAQAARRKAEAGAMLRAENERVAREKEADRRRESDWKAHAKAEAALRVAREEAELERLAMEREANRRESDWEAHAKAEAALRAAREEAELERLAMEREANRRESDWEAHAKAEAALRAAREEAELERLAMEREANRRESDWEAHAKAEAALRVAREEAELERLALEREANRRSSDWEGHAKAEAALRAARERVALEQSLLSRRMKMFDWRVVDRRWRRVSY